LKIPKEYGYIIVFLDYTVEEKMYKPLIIISIYIVLLSIVLVFTVSFFLANRSIKPIKPPGKSRLLLLLTHPMNSGHLSQ